jgi:hypothetical protein
MILKRNGSGLFTLGMYELPRDESEWKAWSEAGINLVCCHTREHLDTAHEYGMYAWVPVPIIVKSDEDEEKLRARVEELRDHPALAVWEGPDEAVWWATRVVPGKVTRLWKQTPDTIEKLTRNVDELVAGFRRGSTIVRELDPHRAIWQNESGSHQGALARIAPYLDAIGFDGYPIPGRIEKPPQHLYLDTVRFRAIAPTKHIWIVQQVFAWGNLDETPGDTPIVYPTLEESRFMAWQAIMAGATGINWWGSSFEDRPTPIIDRVMQVVRELNQLHEFLDGGEAIGVRVEVDGRSYPATQLGVRHLCRRAGDRTMLTIVNLDPFAQDAIVYGMDWADPAQMRPLLDTDAGMVKTSTGWMTEMAPYGVQIYVTD